MIIIRNNLIPFPGYSAITIWPFIFVRRIAWYSNDIDRHEHIHGRQQLEMLLLLFYLWYGLEYIIRLSITRDHVRAYRSISFEQEAYTHEHDEQYLQHRRLYAWLKYLFKWKVNFPIERESSKLA